MALKTHSISLCKDGLLSLIQLLAEIDLDFITCSKTMMINFYQGI